MTSYSQDLGQDENTEVAVPANRECFLENELIGDDCLVVDVSCSASSMLKQQLAVGRCSFY